MRATHLGVTILLLALILPGRAAAAGDKASPAATRFIKVSQGTANLQEAINQVAPNGVIELAAGNYTFGSALTIHSASKSFTMRAEAGQTVVLDGQGTHPVMTVDGASLATAAPVLFEGLTFANGYTNQEGTAGGITLWDAQATFVNCTFRNNTANVATTVGGAVYVVHSRAFFFQTTWSDNVNPFGGGGLGIRTGSNVYVHNSRFIHNVSQSTNPDLQSGGAGISVGNSNLRVSNTRFENNISGGHGAGLYIIGNWQNPVTTPQADVIVANSTFVNNQAFHAPGVANKFPTQGGAINVEDQARLRLYTSRFVQNSAMIGGGMNVFRAMVEIHGSVFQGNLATGQLASNGWGGAIAANSYDSSTPASNVTIEDSLIQGRYGSVGTVAVGAGGLMIGGNGGQRGQATIRRSVFYDVDVASRSAGDSGTAGAVQAIGSQLTMEDSMVLGCDSTGGWGTAGGVQAINGATASIQRSTFAHNSANKAGGALWVYGANINIGNSVFMKNQVADGASTQEWQSYGAAMQIAPADSGASATGTVAYSIFFQNAGLPIFDDDHSAGSINDVRYNDNSFYETTYGDQVYWDALSQSQNVAGLNRLVVSRGGAGATDKGSNNRTMASGTVLGGIRSVPPAILPAGAAGDPAGPMPAYLAYVYNTGSARLDGTALSNDMGLKATTAPGQHTLSVSNSSYATNVPLAAAPSGTLNATYNGSGYTLNWALTSGTYLDAAIDREVTAATGSVGSAQVSASTGTIYRYYVITREGGYVDSVLLGKPELRQPPSVGTILAGKNYRIARSCVAIANSGYGSIAWTATAATTGSLSGRIHVEMPSGQTATATCIAYSVDFSNLGIGQYNDGYIDVNAGAVGNQRLWIRARLANTAYKTYLPSTRR